MVAARFDLTKNYAIEQGANWSILLELPGDWSNHQFAGQIRRVAGGPILAILRFGIVSFTNGITSLPIFLNAGDLVVGGNGAYDIEAIAPSGVIRVLQGQAEITPQITSGAVTDPVTVSVNDALAVRLVLRLDPLEGRVSIIQGDEAIATAITLHNADPNAHTDLSGRRFAPVAMAAIALSAFRVVVLDDQGKWVYANANAVEDAFRIKGITTRASPQGSNVAPLSSGSVAGEGWGWVGDRPIFLGLEGRMTQTVDFNWKFLQPVATSFSANLIVFELQEPTFL